MMKYIFIILFSPLLVSGQNEFSNFCYHQKYPCNDALSGMFPQLKLYTIKGKGFEKGDTRLYVYLDSSKRHELQILYDVNDDSTLTLHMISGDFEFCFGVYTKYLGRAISSNSLLASESDKWKPYFKEQMRKVEMYKEGQRDVWAIRIF